MDALHRLILGLAIALAHIGGWNAVQAATPVVACGCAQAQQTCACTDCPCRARPTPPASVPERDDANVAPTSPRVPAPDRTGVEGVACEPILSVARRARTEALGDWAGDSPFAFRCAWRT